jgi:3-hydroxyacyl-CoA dehydrogenase/enoyl-CoA hydratase/3-hydroxybutyryl-CoA epimerase
MIAERQPSSLVPGAVSPKPGPGSIRRLVRDDKICVLTFDRPGSSANVLDPATISELARELEFIIGAAGLKGLVFLSAKPSIFIAGADLHMFTGSVPSTELQEYLKLGQNLMNRIASLPFPSVAAIHGAALGGGYELCLACDYRLATLDRSTRIGLPETQLGLLPAWGGSKRLPRCVGLPAALDIIPAGKVLGPRPALAAGLVDELILDEDLLQVAVRMIGQGKPHRPSRWPTNNALVASVLGALARRRMQKKTRGNQPAVLKAAEVVAQSVRRSIPDSMAHERKALLGLVQTDACHNLVRGFFLQERARKRVLPGVVPQGGPKPIARAAVIGAGVMGSGIAQWLSARKIPVILRDINAEQVGKGLKRIEKVYQEGVQRQLITPDEARAGLERIQAAPEEVPLGQVDLVIEAATEDLAVKKKIFHQLDELAGNDTILATNTSALPVSELAASTRLPARVLGLHFINPVHRMQLVELVVARQTAPEVLARGLEFTHQIGKLPVVAKDYPGFIVNRVLMPYLMEAVHLFEGGARLTDLDEAMLDFGMPMGPMRLLDEVGLDVALSIAQTLAAGFGDHLNVPELLRQMVQAQCLGRKRGLGFYDHQKGKRPTPHPQARALVRGEKAMRLARAELQQRMVCAMVNEAVRCLEEQVAAEADDIDFAMVMGIGFAPFRGGPLRYADAYGAAKLVSAMRQLVDAGHTYFAPCAMLRDLAESGRKIYADS